MNEIKSFRNAIVCDLDGTIADCNHRLHHVLNKPKNFKAFYEEIPNDTVIDPVWNLIEPFLYQYVFTKLIFLTGREETCRETTIQWIDTNLYNVPAYELFMRPKGDYRLDVVVKSELLDEIEKKYEIACAFEDRERNVKMMRERGIFTFDVNQGEPY